MRFDMQRKPWKLLPAMLLWAASVSAGEPVVFSTTAKVWLDANGVPAKVEVSERVPEVVRPRIAEQVSAWRFEPAKLNGLPSEGITYVALRVCATEGKQRDIRMAVEYRGNGPGYPWGVPRLPPPRYPFEAAKKGIVGTWFVEYTLQTDGRVSVDSIYPEKERQRGRNHFEPALRDWMGQLAFLPEMVAGKPVSTRLRAAIDFSMSDESSRDDTRKEMKSDACLAVKDDGNVLTPVAVDSPFKLLESGS